MFVGCGVVKTQVILDQCQLCLCECRLGVELGVELVIKLRVELGVELDAGGASSQPRM